jgi:hypothetical protein
MRISEGNALAVCSKLGLVEDPRVVQLAESLVAWQWPDGGWNCDKRVEADHSSFNESLSTVWGLLEYQKATGNRDYLKSIEKASELFLEHNLFRSDKTGRSSIRNGRNFTTHCTGTTTSFKP